MPLEIIYANGVFNIGLCVAVFMYIEQAHHGFLHESNKGSNQSKIDVSIMSRTPLGIE
jgi:uncharacterized GH25 family protein